MKNFVAIFVCLSILASTSGKPVDNDDGWVIVPDRSGRPIRVRLDDESVVALASKFKVEEDVTFELYTMENPHEPQILSPENIKSFEQSYFNKSRPTRIYIHGWQERMGMMKKLLNDAYLMKAKKDVNLIAVNWERSSQTVNYIAARKRVEPIGIYVASLIDFMVRTGTADINDIIVIGFSLGAHISGICGKHVTSGKLPKIVGLDPAGPLFAMDKPNQRLDKYDAKYVEIINTSGAFLGFYEQIGSVSFYPNGGRSQGGCGWDPTGTCSHLRAYKYFGESLYSTVSFFAYPCDSMEAMEKRDCKGVGLRMGGEPGNFKAESAIYLLTTNNKPIFARGGSRDM